MSVKADPDRWSQELVRLYKIINDSSTCEKLKKDIFRVPTLRFSHYYPD